MGLPEDKHHDVYDYVDPCGRLQGAAKGLKVLVTGASKGCGRSMAVAFAQAGAAQLFLVARDEQGLAETSQLVLEANAGCKTFRYRVDMSLADVIPSFQGILKDAGGRVDILINKCGHSLGHQATVMRAVQCSAGTSAEWITIDDSDPADYWRCFEVNVRSVYLATKAVLPSMIKHGGGTIINIVSNSTLVTWSGSSAYATCKSAVIRFTAYLDADHDAQGIRAFGLHPGGVKTALTDWRLPDKYQHLLIDKPELGGAVSVYLTTREADYLRGRYLHANWDMKQLLQRGDEILEKDLFKTTLAC